MLFMNLTQYERQIDNISISDLLCRCCGARLYVLSNAKESICNFCESYVSSDDANVVHGNSDTEKNLLNMQRCTVEKRWSDGVAFADALVATRDPHFLFGAASFYQFFSDYTYNDVNYELPGFMYSNAEKRSDEPQKNKYNAMSLISKSKEYLFKIIKIINDTPNPPDTLLFLSFMSNIKLKRYPQAMNLLQSLNAPSVNGVIRDYSNMVFSVEKRDKKAEINMSKSFSQGISNSYYYLAKYFAMKRHIDRSIQLLNQFTGKVNMPSAAEFNKNLKDVAASSQL